MSPKARSLVFTAIVVLAALFVDWRAADLYESGPHSTKPIVIVCWMLFGVATYLVSLRIVNRTLVRLRTRALRMYFPSATMFVSLPWTLIGQVRRLQQSLKPDLPGRGIALSLPSVVITAAGLTVWRGGVLPELVLELPREKIMAVAVDRMLDASGRHQTLAVSISNGGVITVLELPVLQPQGWSRASAGDLAALVTSAQRVLQLAR